MVIGLIFCVGWWFGFLCSFERKGFVCIFLGFRSRFRFLRKKVVLDNIEKLGVMVYNEIIFCLGFIIIKVNFFILFDIGLKVSIDLLWKILNFFFYGFGGLYGINYL